jgi:hypothetical protein
MTVAIREIFKNIDRKNPISGHEWTEHGPTTGYEIAGPFGVVDRARTQAGAERRRADWQSYYDRLEKA